MDKNLKLLENVVMSGNKLLLKQLCEREGYTEADIAKVMTGMGRKLRLALQARGEIETMDEIEKLIGDDGYDD